MALSANDRTELQNTFFDRVPRMFWSEGYQKPEYSGILSVTLPLIALLIVFFIIKKNIYFKVVRCHSNNYLCHIFCFYKQTILCGLIFLPIA